MQRKSLFLGAIFLSTASGHLCANTPMFDHDLITSLYYQGTLCPQNTLRADALDQNRLLQLDYYRMNMFVNDTDAYRAGSCNVSIGLDVPYGWQVSFSQVTQEGYAYGRDDYAEGVIEIEAQIDHARYPARVTNRRQRGPFHQNYRFSDYVDQRQSQWTECYSTRESQVRLGTRYEAQVFRSGSVFEFRGQQLGANHVTRQTWEIEWRRCDETPQPPTQEWDGRCLVVLETIWGTDVSDHWGRSRASSHGEALYLARSQASDLCMSARNNSNIMKCTVVESQCDATRRQ